jgi:hypothetical protein
MYLTTRTASGVIIPVTTPRASAVIRPEPLDELHLSAVQAHEAANISYRQLDHWARQGWVTPSIDRGEGRAGKRLYSARDVVRLDLLRHLALSGVSPTVAGPSVVELPIDESAFILWGPAGLREAPTGLRSVATEREALELMQRGGSYVLYRCTGVLDRVRSLLDSPIAPTAVPDVRPVTKRRSA